MRIDQLSRSETARLRAIRLRSLLDSPDAFASTHAEVVARPSESWQHQLDDLATFVAVVDGDDAGIVRVAPDDNDETAKWLISMWVAPESRGQGVGDALILTVTTWAKQAGVTRISLEVGDHNAPAIALYERMGFERNGIVTQFNPPREHITEHQRVLELN